MIVLDYEIGLNARDRQQSKFSGANRFGWNNIFWLVTNIWSKQR